MSECVSEALPQVSPRHRACDPDRDGTCTPADAFICMYIHIHMCIFIVVCMYMYIYICIFIYTYICMYIYMCIRICTNVCIYLYILVG